MEAESYWVYERLRLNELLEQHPNWSIRQYSRVIGHDPKWVRKWKGRLRGTQPVTLDTVRSQSRVPHRHPHQIALAIANWIVQLRAELSEQYHRQAGAKTILYALQTLQPPVPMPLPKSTSTITRILRERGCIAPPRPRWHELLVLPAPMEEWELDFGQIRLNSEDIFEFVMVVDRGTSRLVYLEGSAGYNAETALEAVARLLLLCGLPRRLRFDRDPRLWGAWTRDSYPSPFIRFLRVLGVEPVVCPPHRPDKKPVVERTIFTFKHEWLARFALTTVGDAKAVSALFPYYYNEERPHQGRACQNRPPNAAFPVLPPLPHLPQQVQPDQWLADYQGRVYRRHVSSTGTIQVDRHTYFVDSTLAKQLVLVQLDALQRCLRVSHEGRLVKQLPLRGLYGMEAMDFSAFLIAMQAEARTVELHRHFLWERQSDD